MRYGIRRAFGAPLAAGNRRGGVMKSALALVVFTSAAGILGWMFLAPGALEQEIEARTGFSVKADVLSINPFGVSLTGENVVIENSGIYGGGAPLMVIEHLKAEASLPSLARGEIWIYELDLRIKKATLVTDERGRLNLDTFATHLFAPKDGSPPAPFYAEKVRLVIEEILFVDNSRVIPSSRSVRVMLDVELSDLDSPEKVFAPLRQLAGSVGQLPLD